MSMSKVMRQMPTQVGREAVGRGETAHEAASDETCDPRHDTKDTGSALLKDALTKENLQTALKRVRANKGAAGVDGMDINQTVQHLRSAWPAIKEQLLAGTYRPSAVRRVTIPKPDGGQRELGIPTVTDRLIQQALLQVLQPILDANFSESSYGFRPGAAPTKRYWPRRRMCKRASKSWLMWTWRNSSTGSTTTSSSTAYKNALMTPQSSD
jgi:hypothetical protein